MDKNEDKQLPKTNLIKLRGDRSQEYVAKHTGLTQQAYRNYESGERQAKYEILIRLADYFNVTLDYLLCRQFPNISENRQKLFDKVQTLSEEQVAVLLSIADKLK